MKEIEILNKPNELISIISDRNISITQRRAYNIFLKFAQNKIKFEDYKENLFEIHYIDLYEKSNIKNKNQDYVEEEEIENLMRTLVKIKDKENKKNWEMFTLLSYVKRKGDYFQFELNHFIINALKEQTFFTTIDLITSNSLSSQYSVIFYELAIRYEKFKIPKMSIEEIREITGTVNEYSRIEALKRRVLDVACDEITEKTDIKLSYTAEKIGRNIAFIDFKIERKKEELPKTFEEMEECIENEYFTNEQEEKIKETCKSKIMFSTAKNLFNEYPKEEFDYLIYCLERTEEKANSNPIGYFKKVVEELRVEYENYKELEREKLELRKKIEEIERKEKELKKQAEAEKEKILQDKNSNKYLEAEKEVIKNLQKGYIGEGRYKNYEVNDIPKEIIEHYIKYAID